MGVVVKFEKAKMQSLLEHDRFLRETYNDTIQVMDEEEALRLLYDVMILKEPLKQNAYLHLT